MNDYQKQLSEIEEKVNNAKLKKATLEERGRKLLEEQTEILEKLKEEKIEEKNLQDKIIDLEIEIEKELNKCQEILKST